MPLYIKDDETAALVTDLADKLVTTKQEAVKRAVKAELQRLEPELSFREKLEALRARHPPPRPTGEAADKAFYDELSGEFG